MPSCDGHCVADRLLVEWDCQLAGFIGNAICPSCSGGRLDVSLGSMFVRVEVRSCTQSPCLAVGYASRVSNMPPLEKN